MGLFIIWCILHVLYFIVLRNGLLNAFTIMSMCGDCFVVECFGVVLCLSRPFIT